MTALGPRQGKRGFQQTDPQDFAQQLPMFLRADITFESATQTIGTVPAGATILRRIVTKRTVWDAVTTFEIGNSGDTDAYASTAQSNVTVAGVEITTIGEVVSSDTDILVTLNQGAATQGAATVLVEFLEKMKDD